MPVASPPPVAVLADHPDSRLDAIALAEVAIVVAPALV